MGEDPGLSAAAAVRQLLVDGANELPAAKSGRLLVTIVEAVREPMFLLLLACGGLYLALGDSREALMLLGFVVVVLGITFAQKRKTERALTALRDLSSPRALVIRDGRRQRIPGRDVVHGDLVVLAEGDRIPADAVVVECAGLAVDESMLTGESVPVRKAVTAATAAPAPPGGEDRPLVFSGTLVVQGHGIARVTATGPRTQMGGIGRALQDLPEERTPLQNEIARLVRRIALIGLALCIAVTVWYAVQRGSWTGGLLAGIALAMALLPEEFPAVLTIFFALGAWRLSRRRILTRRVAVIEALGGASVLCVDKTGTLTVNRMALRRLTVAGETLELVDGETALPERFHLLVEFGILASQRDPFDAMEKAFHELGGQRLAGTEHLHGDWRLVREYPLSPQLLALSHVWRSPAGDDYVIAAKGAPEAIIDLCHLNHPAAAAILAGVDAMAGNGLRVLAVAKGAWRRSDLPSIQHDIDFTFLGLVGLADPLRPKVAAAVGECAAAGIRVVMITGDHATTAASIARQAGIGGSGQVVTGSELGSMDDAALRRCVAATNIFARMVPEQKLRLVQAMKAQGAVVAMTGDGVNDAPALKAAHIGIAMGGRGTDVAREAAALVLLDDDFASIVTAVRMGRRIFDHLRKALAYIVAIHVPIAGMSLLPVVLGWPLALFPAHILFLQLIIDPACTLVFEADPESNDLMQRPPRDPNAALFDRRTLLLSLLQGAAVLLVVLIVYAINGARVGDADRARTLAFTTLVVANLGLILGNRSWSRTLLTTLRRPNPAVWWVLAGTSALLAAVLSVPLLRTLFHFAAVPASAVAFAAGLGLLPLAGSELLKLGRRHRSPAAVTA